MSVKVYFTNKDHLFQELNTFYSDFDNVDISNFYRAKNAQEAIAIAKDNQEGYSGVLYHSNHDGDVCAVFDQSCILGKA